MIDNISVIKHNKLILYSLNDFFDDINMQNSIRRAKSEAISQKYASCHVEEIGNGSSNNTSVFCIPNPDIPGEKLALKIISYITTTYSHEQEADEVIRDLGNDIHTKNRIIEEIINGLKTQDCRNVIPLSGYDTIIWKCPKYNRIGIDYVLKMPLAECISNTISRYIIRRNAKTHTLLMEEKPASEELILQIGLDLCIALQDLHTQGIIHRDIKPDNIFWYREHYCLGDFGIAVENPSLQNFHVGTEQYCAPEQALDIFTDKYDHRMDIYSLGLVLYELADTMPVSAHYNQRIKEQYLPDLPSVSKGLNEILHKACQFDPSNRYQSAEAFWSDLHLIQKNPTYIPSYPVPKNSYAYAASGIKTAGTSMDTAYSSGRKGSPYGRKQLQKKAENSIVSPETIWKAGKFWYEESCKQGNRFAGLDIDKRIMSLSSTTSSHVTDLPINVFTDQRSGNHQKPLSEIISRPEELHNMYLIGEGGIGKTTALYSIMEDTYRNKIYSEPDGDEKQIIPLFIELSKAPACYCGAYAAAQSTFIRRYLFMLITSLSSQHLISENAVEMTRIMQTENIAAVQKVDNLLRSNNDKAHYLLLLDGLNEVSRIQLSDPDDNYIGTPSRLIIDEMQELLKYSNISIIITSRADEMLGNSERLFNRLYLTGVSETDIKKYLTQNRLSYKTVQNNKRLMETLKIPLFLKLYSQLYLTSEVSTPGEILYAFFSERSAKYTVRNRIMKIKEDQRSSGESPATNLINTKMQWFILDFLLPELGWYMEKNELYAVNLTMIKEVIDSVLTGTLDSDICGKYGTTMFCDYHNGRDGSVNTRTYAEQLLGLTSDHQGYIQVIVDYCVYSFGILYVNNDNYSFIHQHVRDFFAALKIITDLKFAIHIQEQYQDKTASMKRLNELNNTLLSTSVSQFMSELSDTLNMEYRYNFYITTLKIYRNIFNDQAALGVKNIVQIIYRLQGNLANINLSELDLRNVPLHGIDIKNSLFHHSLINKKNFSEKKEAVSWFEDAIFSPDNKHMILLDHKQFRIYNVVSLYEEYVSPEFKTTHYGRITVEYSPSGNLFYIFFESWDKPFPHIIEVWDSNKHKKLKKIRIFEIFHLDINLSGRRFVKISPDDSYLIVASNFNKFMLYPIFSELKKERIFLRRHSQLNFVARLFGGCSCIAADPCKKYIAFENSRFFKAKDLNVFIYNAETLKYETDISISSLEEHEYITYLLFSPNGEYLAVISSDSIYILATYNWTVYRTLSNKTRYGEIKRYIEGKFLYYNSAQCLLLPLKSKHDEYIYVLWEIKKNNLIHMESENNKEIFDCLNTSILFREDENLKLQKVLFDSSTEQTIYEKYDYKHPGRITDAFYTLDHKYFVIYSEKYIQIRDSSSHEILHELSFQKEISSVCCSNSELYVAMSQGDIEIVEIETCKTKNVIATHFSIYGIALSPKHKYIIVEHDIDSEHNLHTFTIYDSVTFILVYTFYSRRLLFSPLDDKLILAFSSGNVKSKLMEQWSIKKCDGQYQIKLLNTVHWETIGKKLKKHGYYLGIYTWQFIPRADKLAVYIYQDDVYKLFIWDLKNLTCEKDLKALRPTNFFHALNGFFAAESGISSLKIRDFKNLKYDSRIQINESYRDTGSITVYENEVLLLYNDRVVILNLISGEYKSVLFLPGINVQNAEFTQLHSTSDIDDNFLKGLKMHNAIID